MMDMTISALSVETLMALEIGVAVMAAFSGTLFGGALFGDALFGGAYCSTDGGFKESSAGPYTGEKTGVAAALVNTASFRVGASKQKPELLCVVAKNSLRGQQIQQKFKTALQH